MSDHDQVSSNCHSGLGDNDKRGMVASEDGAGRWRDDLHAALGAALLAPIASHQLSARRQL